ncbi:e6bd5174-bf34-46e1-b6e4-0fcf374083ad [Sclerotinia trifoliorum]|uniref:E6bd5174-bf34-46e1-b6e4-0fcf374083ad n=1 Tax=Sclerotinia trifoliorum TaxID=28548 RepID=A0A8H2VL39_9HELO|nr:e6bd5174-bf34-46e1-b6e4-0fcf374083ad [Sclerotinia trifoliorum]
MEPAHITEFASERYFSKLRQINENDHGSTSASPSTTGITFNAQIGPSTLPTINHEPSPLEAATFNLPSRQRNANHENLVLRPSDQRKRSLGHDLTSLRTQRRPSFSGSLGALRSKVNITHKAPSIVETHQGLIVERIERQSVTLSDLFLALPNELQAQIIAPLPIHTILDLRQVSRSFHALVTLNEAPIARYHAAHTLPDYTIRLYPLPEPRNLNLHYLGGIWHRLHVASKLSTMISLQARKEIFLRTTEAQKAEFQPQHERMRQRLIPLVFTIFHFFETYRNIYAQHLARRGAPLTRLPYTLNPFESYVMSMYDDRTLLHVHQVFPLVMSSFSRRLRPPSYVGRVERSIRGYLKDRPPDEVYATILTVGGLRQAQRFWETKGYNARRAAVDQWYGFLQSSRLPIVEPNAVTPKSKMSKFTHLGRKKAPQLMAQHPLDNSGHDSSRCNEWFCVKPNCIAARRNTSDDSMVGRTSLSAGPPMRPLGREELRLLMENIPDLHDIWAKTAEATILERGIVDRPERIKKNSLVLLDLIKEDGRDEMEGWESGRTGGNAADGSEVIDAGAVSD